MTATKSSAISVCIKRTNNTGDVKKVRNEKTNKSVILFSTSIRKADEILSDFPDRIIIRFFCVRHSEHFYLSP